MAIDERAFQEAAKACSCGPVHSLRAAIEAYEAAKQPRQAPVDWPCAACGKPMNSGQCSVTARGNHIAKAVPIQAGVMPKAFCSEIRDTEHDVKPDFASSSRLAGGAGSGNAPEAAGTTGTVTTAIRSSSPPAIDSESGGCEDEGCPHFGKALKCDPKPGGCVATVPATDQPVDCRIAFEKWHDNTFDVSAEHVRGPYGYPLNATIQTRWQAWQFAWEAARVTKRESVWVRIEDFRGEPRDYPLGWWWSEVDPEGQIELDEILLDENGAIGGKGGCGMQFYSHVMPAGFERPKRPDNRRKSPEEKP